MDKFLSQKEISQLFKGLIKSNDLTFYENNTEYYRGIFHQKEFHTIYNVNFNHIIDNERLKSYTKFLNKVNAICIKNNLNFDICTNINFGLSLKIIQAIPNKVLQFYDKANWDYLCTSFVRRLIPTVCEEIGYAGHGNYWFRFDKDSNFTLVIELYKKQYISLKRGYKYEIIEGFDPNIWIKPIESELIAKYGKVTYLGMTETPPPPEYDRTKPEKRSESWYLNFKIEH